MRLLLFSDIHCDALAARRIVERCADADVLVCAGDLAVMREGLQDMVDILAAVTTPTVLVAGNGESDVELAAACAGWSNAQVLHGSGCEIEGVAFWGLGGALPPTPHDWSFDLEEDEGRALLDGCPGDAVLIVHSPPFGHVDEMDGRHLGSRAVLETIERTHPRLAVCGHIHACWTQESRVGDTRIVNAGPDGIWLDV